MTRIFGFFASAAFAASSAKSIGAAKSRAVRGRGARKRIFMGAGSVERRGHGTTEIRRSFRQDARYRWRKSGYIEASRVGSPIEPLITRRVALFPDCVIS